ncbi:hypothetical protein [Streptomyces sp. NPDC048639]|uniref:hypothetical protein n=1 Tax=Streptomyces sp. NPDC048639 TaxID=3365581 RepID=UPI003718616D
MSVYIPTHMPARLRDLRRRRAERATAARLAQRDFAGLIQSDLAAELPDEDVREDLDDSLDLYEPGSKPRCEEVEYIALLREAIERMERGR